MGLAQHQINPDAPKDHPGGLPPRMPRFFGFSLIELMIVVTIIGILAVVAIPAYMAYIQRSRIVALVFPGLHAMETNIALYYATYKAMPDSDKLVPMMDGADTAYFHPILNGAELRVIIDAPLNTSPLYALNGATLIAVPNTVSDKIVTWTLSGSLAERLGIAP